jgi:hypothetical protein
MAALSAALREELQDHLQQNGHAPAPSRFPTRLSDPRCIVLSSRPTWRNRRACALWYHSKRQPATAEMVAKLRRTIIVARFKPSRPSQPSRAEIQAIRLAWEDASP